MFTYMDDKYTVLEDTIITWNSDETMLRVPTIFNGHRITRIGAGAFAQCKQLREVVIGDGIEIIGNEAFRGCTDIRTLVMPDTVKEIGEGAFGDCSALRKITFSKNITKIGTEAFENCYRVGEFRLPSGIISDASFIDFMPRGNNYNVFIDFCLDNDKFKELTSKCIVLSDNRYLITEELTGSDWMATINKLNMPNVIDKSMHTIFLIDAPEIDVAYDMSRTVLSWEGLARTDKDINAIRKRIHDDAHTYISDVDEKEWVSARLREENALARIYSDKSYALDFCVIERVERVGDMTRGTIRVYKMFGYFISVHKVIDKGVTYYIYSRNYLVGKYMRRLDRISNELPRYSRVDMAVYCGDEMIIDQKKSEAVYAKYKLFSIL